MNNSVTKTIQVNRKDYKIVCNANEVENLQNSARMLDERVKKIAASSGRKLDDVTLLLFASLELENLLLTKEQNHIDNSKNYSDREKLINSLVSTIENFIDKIENIG